MVVLAALTAALLRPAWTAAPPASLDAPEWRKAAHERFQNTDVYLLEDGTSLYVAFDATAADAQNGDAVSLYLWSDKAAYHFKADAKGAASGTCSAGAMPQWTAKETPAHDGYRVVMRFPEAMFTRGGQSHWLVQFAREVPGRHLAYTWPASSAQPGNVLYATAFSGRAADAFNAAANVASEPAVAPASQVQRLWTDPAASLPSPEIPSNAQGVAVAQSRDNFHFAGVEAKGADGSQHNAQSVGWSSTDGHTSAGVARIASANGSAYDVTQALSFAFDNQQNMRFSAGVSGDRGSDVSDASQANYSYYDFSLYGEDSAFEMRWNTAGPQYNDTSGDAPAPGTRGYTLTASRQFGSISVNAGADRYRDDFGDLASGDERAAISAALSPTFTFDVDAAANAATQYDTLPFAQSGAQLQYQHGGQSARLSYHQDSYDGGIARELAISGGFDVPLLGTMQLAHRQTMTTGVLALMEPEESDSASLMHRLQHGTVSLGYQYAAGAANVTFSFEDRLPIGLIRATYFNPNTRFSTPNFSLKFVTL